MNLSRLQRNRMPHKQRGFIGAAIGLSGLWATAATGAVIGGVTSLATGGNVLQGAALGGIAGGLGGLFSGAASASEIATNTQALVDAGMIESAAVNAANAGMTAADLQGMLDQGMSMADISAIAQDAPAISAATIAANKGDPSLLNQLSSAAKKFVGDNAGKLLTTAAGVAAYQALKTNPQNPSQYVVDPATGKVISSSVTTPSGTTTTLDPRIRGLQAHSLAGTEANVIDFQQRLANVQQEQNKLYGVASDPSFNLNAALESYNKDIGGVKATQANVLGQFGALGTKSGGANMNLDAATGTFKSGYTPLQGQQADVYGKFGDLYSKAGANAGGYVQSAIDPTIAAGAQAIGSETANQGLRGISGSSFGGQNLANVTTDVGRQITDAKSKALQESLGLQAGLAGSMGTETQAQMGAVKDIYGADQTALQARQAQIDQQAKMASAQLGVSQAQQATAAGEMTAAQQALDAQHSQIATQLGISKEQVSLLAMKLSSGQQLTAQENTLAGTLTDTQLAQMKLGTTGAALGATNVTGQNNALGRVISGVGGALGNTNALGQPITA